MGYAKETMGEKGREAVSAHWHELRDNLRGVGA